MILGLTEENWLTLWLAILTTFGGILTAYVATSGSRKEKKLEATAARLKTEAEERAERLRSETERETSLVNQLQEEVASLRASRQEDQATIRTLFSEFNELKAIQIESNIGIKILINQIVDSGSTPLWIPQSPL